MLIIWFEKLAKLRTCFRGPALLIGFLSGLLMLCAATPLRLLLGFSHEVDAALVLTAGAACCLVNTLLRHHGRSRLASGALLIAGFWTLLEPYWLPLCLRLTGAVSLSALEQPGVSFVLFYCCCLLGMLPVTTAAGLTYRRVAAQGLPSAFCWLVGLTVSLLVLPAAVLPFIGVWWLTWIALAGGAVVLLVDLRTVPLNTESSGHDDIQPETSGRVQVLASAAAVGLGGLLSVVLFIGMQLVPRNLITDGALLAGFTLGVAFAAVRRAFGTGTHGSLSRVCLKAAAWGVILAAGYPLWTLYCLRTNSWVSQVAMIVLYRSLLLAGLMFPMGYLAGRLRHSVRTAAPTAIVPMGMAAGFSLIPLIPMTPWLMVVVLGGSLLLLGLGSAVADHRQTATTRQQRWGLGLTAGVALLGLLAANNLAPSTSERMLFTATALQSYRQGIVPAQLGWIDDTRQLADFTTLQSHVSLWRQRGTQVIQRRNGMILGLHSANTRQSPQNAGDLLPALLPLAIHPDPEHVLVLGIHSPTLIACHTWPLRSVHCIDGGSENHRMLDWLMSSREGGLQLSNGPQFQFHHAASSLSLYSRHSQQYDVITCPIVHPGTPEAVNQLTREFYLQARAHLSSDGIFSQRLPYFDLGPEFVKGVVSTLQSVFGEVRAIESTPGELIFVCSAQQLPPIDDLFVERLKSPQVRTLLAESGWDWSLILGRGGVDDGHLRELCDGKTGVSSCGGSTFAYWLPVELARWGRKGDATRLTLAKYGDALRTSLGDSTGGKEVTERLEDLNLAHQIQRDHPNDPWAYRAALKSRLQNRPRASFVQVNHELKRGLDPEDQRRKEYLLALGPAAKNPRPSPESIEQLAAFDAPFDPLVSLFVYSETANLFHRCDPPQVSQQLLHLLHTVYFSSGYDQSIRNVADATLILCRHPEIITSEVDRWDELNSLMQMMAQRWQMRLGDQKLSKYELSDTERSLEAIDACLAELEAKRSIAGLTSQEWAMRKLTLEQALVRPLRAHRSNQAREAALAPVENKTR